MYADFAFFSIVGLSNNVTDYKVTSDTSGRTYVFNFCEYVVLPCGDDSTNAYAYSYKDTVSNECQLLTGDQITLAKADAIKYEEMDHNISAATHILFTESDGPACGDQESSSITFEILCSNDTLAHTFVIDD